MAKEVLILGASDSGKTLLLKSLKYCHENDGKIWEFGDIPQHVPTIGSNYVEFQFECKDADGSKSKVKKKLRKMLEGDSAILENTRKTLSLDQPTHHCINLRELGGQMLPLWENYYEACAACLFVIDVAFPFNVEQVLAILKDCLKHRNLTTVPFLVCFTKSDINGALNGQDLIKTVLSSASRPNVYHCECSALSGLRIKEILLWIENVAKMKK